jgi:hypothetical protein
MAEAAAGLALEVVVFQALGKQQQESWHLQMPTTLLCLLMLAQGALLQVMEAMGSSLIRQQVVMVLRFSYPLLHRFVHQDTIY